MSARLHNDEYQRRLRMCAILGSLVGSSTHASMTSPKATISERRGREPQHEREYSFNLRRAVAGLTCASLTKFWITSGRAT